MLDRVDVQEAQTLVRLSMGGVDALLDLVVGKKPPGACFADPLMVLCKVAISSAYNRGHLCPAGPSAMHTSHME